MLDIKKIKFDDFFRHSALMVISSIVGGGCNYLYQIFMGRNLSPEEFGIFGALFALFYLISVFSGTIQAGVARFIASFKGEGKEDYLTPFVSGLFWRMCLVAFTITVLFYFLIPAIADFLHIESYIELIILGTVIFLSLLTPVMCGALQGIQNFRILSIAGFLSPLFKLLSGVLLILMGFGVAGAMGALTVGLILTIILYYIPLRKFIRLGGRGRFKFLDLYLYSLPTLIIMFCLAIPSNLDVILVKNMYSGYDAGIYTAAAVIGKIVLFASGMIPVVLFPKIVNIQSQGQSTLPLLHRGLLYVALLSGSVAAVFFVFPTLIVKIFGSVYSDAYPLTALYVIMMFFISLVTLLAQYALAKKRQNYAFVLAVFTVAEILLILLVSVSLETLVLIMMIVNGTLLIASYIFLRKE